ncbi:hypothetical protein OG625_18690 [Streptomyces sp. NBC_01351]|nr:hypothetical protein [Streptomyces sp. NBC_01351]
MRILRKLFKLPTPPAPPPITPPADSGADDWVGESWVWVPGDLDEEVDR